MSDQTGTTARRYFAARHPRFGAGTACVLPRGDPFALPIAGDQALAVLVTPEKPGAFDPFAVTMLVREELEALEELPEATP